MLNLSLAMLKILKKHLKKECKNYHDFGGDIGSLDNDIHPDRPEGKEYECPICDIFDE